MRMKRSLQRNFKSECLQQCRHFSLFILIRKESYYEIQNKKFICVDAGAAAVHKPAADKRAGIKCEWKYKQFLYV